MKKILSSMIVASFVLTACGENADTTSNEENVNVVVVEEQVIPPVVEEIEVVVSDETADKPSFSASHSITVTSVVEAINHETREVSLRQEDGSLTEFVASEEARNLDQVQVGDIVVVEYEESIDAQVVTVENAQAEVDEATVAARTKKGEMPGVAVIDAVVVTAVVEEINLEANTFKLKGPEGNIEEFTAQNPENLKKAAVGDLLVITYSKAFILTVEKAPAAE